MKFLIHFTFKKAAWLTCGLVMISVAANAQKKKAKPLNVLFIVSDDLRPDLHCYGDPIAITPNIDQLASDGIRFNKAYCQQAVCNPSRASILTGLRPDQDGVTDLVTNFRQVLPDVVTLPQLFKKNGYMTVDIGKIFHGKATTQDSLSWSVPAVFNVAVKKNEYYLAENRKKGKTSSYEAADVADNEYTDGKIADLGVKWLHRFKQNGKPFFLALGFKKPHLPFSSPGRYWEMYNREQFMLGIDSLKPVGAPQVAFHHWEELRGYKDIPDEGSLSWEKADSLRWGYYACISFVDAQVGKVIKTLKELGLDKNTVIVLWGDHGYHLGEQDLWCKSTNFELDNRMPLIIKIPDQEPKGKSVEALVEAVDIYPTLTELCHIKPESSLTGVSLVPFLVNPSHHWNRAAYSQFIRPYGALFSKFSGKARYMGYSVRTKKYRCTIWYDLHTGTPTYKELYDLGEDYIERKNIAKDSRYVATLKKLTYLVENYKNKKY